jgi:hypothetical protein
MNRCVLLVFIMMSNILCGMELIEQKVKTFTFPTIPPIIVVHDDIFDRKTKNADVTVIGVNEQKVLRGKLCSYDIFIGSLPYCDGCIVRKKKAFEQYFDRSYGFRDKSAVIIIDGERFTIKNPYEHVEEIKVGNKIIMIVEPRIFFTSIDEEDGKYQNRKLQEHYWRYVRVPDETELLKEDYYGREAIKEALEDLYKVYRTALIHGYRSLESVEGSIALVPLSDSLGISPHDVAIVAIQACMKFINDYRDKQTCGSIELVVSREKDFEMYKDFLNCYKLDKATGDWVCY